MSDKKLDLIAQMFAKAESTTPEEAEALMQAAEKLMIKYGFDQAVIDARRAKAGGVAEEIVQKSMEFTGAYRGEMINLGAAVCRGLGSLQNLQSTTRNKGKTFVLYIIGFESDVDQAIMLISSLQLQAAVAVRAWWKKNQSEYSLASSYNQEKARRSFVHGFGTGAGVRIAQSRQEAFESVSKGTEMVLVSRSAKVQEHFDNIAKRNGRVRSATGGGAAAHDGYAAGKQANTGGKSVSQGRGIEA